MLSPVTAMKLVKSNLGTFAGCGLALAILCSLVSLGQPVALAQSHALKHTMEARSAFATGMEGQLRQRGIDARVQLEGDQRDVLHVEWQTVSRRDIYAFVNSTAVREAADRGFRTIAFTNGEQRWDYDLARNSMVWNTSSAE
jgi:hypothetical protein